MSRHAARPAFVVKPVTTGEVAQVVAAAVRHSVPLTARGSGTGLSGACVPSAGGVFVSGGSAANLSALVVARDTELRRRASVGLPATTLRVAVSDQAHSSITNALNITAMAPFLVETEDGRLTEEALRAAIDADPDVPDLCAVVATAGTTNAGILDDIAGAGRVAREHGWWLHVDGAYGGAGMLARGIRHRYDGI